MTVGGMGFIPERLLMMMMMKSGQQIITIMIIEGLSLLQSMNIPLTKTNKQIYINMVLFGVSGLL